MVNFLKRQRSRIQSFGCKTSIFTGFFCRHTANRSVAWRHKEWQAGWEVAWPGESRESLGALTICMENTVIPRRIQMERFIPVEISGKNVIPFRYYLFPVLTETTKIFCTTLVNQLKCQASCWGGRWKMAVISQEGYTFLFSETFSSPVPFVRNLLPKFPNKWQTFLDSPRFPRVVFHWLPTIWTSRYTIWTPGIG